MAVVSNRAGRHLQGLVRNATPEVKGYNDMIHNSMRSHDLTQSRSGTGLDLQ